jgi:glycosyltransferase
MPPHPTFYVRRALVAELGTFDTGFRIASDYDFMLRLLRRPGVVVRYVPQVLVRMRTGGASNRSASALWRKSSEDWRALRKNGVGGLSSLLCKNLRKLPQFFARRAIARSSDGPG